MKEILTKELDLSPSQLYVSDLSKLTEYYSKYAGLQILESSGSRSILGHKDTPIIELVSKKNLQFASNGTAGLFHNAILFESRGDLSKAVSGIATHAPETFIGTGDHLVSEAFYFTDPEGNGLELYADRSPEAWTWRNGQVQMDTLYIDPNKFLQEHLGDEVGNGIKLGHVHLKVGDISKAREFYVNNLGFNITALLPGAMFMSVAGYHHHIAVNTWQSFDAQKRQSTLGLSKIQIIVKSKDDLDRLVNRLEQSKWRHSSKSSAIRTLDPWGNRLVFSSK